jgi:hypothetical protein
MHLFNRFAIRIENLKLLGAYPENPSYHIKSPVGAASSREII